MLVAIGSTVKLTGCPSHEGPNVKSSPGVAEKYRVMVSVTETHGELPTAVS